MQESAAGKQFYFDPGGRLDTILSSAGAALARFQYDGSNLVAEVDPAASNAVARRYVWGPSADEPLVWYEGSGTTGKRYLSADERGSIVAVTDESGGVLGLNTYDEHGIPGSGNLGRFQYTGQAWLPELGMYHFKARTYSPTLGRFLQTDPIGYGDGISWYNYGGADPVNNRDPSGLTTGTNVDWGPGICPACSGSTWSIYGDAGNRERADRAQSPEGLTGALAATEFTDPSGNQIGTTPAGFTPDDLFSNPDAGDFDQAFPGAAEGEVILVTGRTIPPELADGPRWSFKIGPDEGGLPFWATRKARHGSDTISTTRSQAFRSAKYLNDIPASRQPIITYRPGLIGGGNGIGMDRTNVVYYLFINSAGQPIGIREDMANSFQPPHFNSGPAGTVENPTQNLPNHSYWTGK